MNIQDFLNKHKDFYLTAFENTIAIEVRCKLRGFVLTNEEVEDIKSLGLLNMWDKTNYKACCCGDSTFIIYDPNDKK